MKLAEGEKRRGFPFVPLDLPLTLNECLRGAAEARKPSVHTSVRTGAAIRGGLGGLLRS